MDPSRLVATRESLHGVAELVLAGPQFACCGDIRLRVTANGFSTVGEPDLAVEADALVTPAGRLPFNGTLAALASRAGVQPRNLRDVYPGGPTMGPDDELSVDDSAAREILGALSRGDAAMRLFAPSQQPVLWPEHFDVGISVGEVNYGVSPGDATIAQPYAYVGPWQARTGSFWNADFGAFRPMHELLTPTDVMEFFQAGRAQVDLDAGSH